MLLFCLFVHILFGTNLDNWLFLCCFFFYIEYLNIFKISLDFILKLDVTVYFILLIVFVYFSSFWL